jgi:hypothetical protein
MIHVKRTLATGGLVLAAAGALATHAVTSPAATSEPRSGRTISLTAITDRQSVHTEDVRPKGPSMGDQIVWSARLLSNRRVVGRFEAVSTAVDKRYEGISHRFTLLLADGTIEVSGAGPGRRIPGLPNQEDQEIAIVGGTGAYSGASGSYQMRYSNDRITHITLRLNG